VCVCVCVCVFVSVCSFLCVRFCVFISPEIHRVLMDAPFAQVCRKAFVEVSSNSDNFLQLYAFFVNVLSPKIHIFLP